MAALALPYNAIDGNGAPLPGAKMFTYIKDTTTNQVVYTDSGLTVPASNPVIADSDGQIRVYLDDTLDYSIDVRDSTEASIRLQMDFTSGDAEPFVITRATHQGLQGLSAGITDLSDEIRLVAANDVDISIIAANLATLQAVVAALPLTPDVSSQNTNADLKALTGLEAGLVFVTLGRTSIGDAGGGVWMIREGGFSAEVTADADELEWMALDEDPDGDTIVAQRIDAGVERYTRIISDNAVAEIYLGLGTLRAANFSIASASGVGYGNIWVRNDGITRRMGGTITPIDNTLLTGTVGTDGAVSVSYNGGKLRVENRSGATHNFEIKRTA